MTTDAWLAIAHHVAVFTLLGSLAAEWALVQPGLTPAAAARVARIDLVYGISAGAVVVFGILRLVFGAKDFDFYSGNPLFWLKMASLAAVAVLSIRPTLAYFRWQKVEFAVSDSDVAAVHQSLLRQLAVFPLIPIFAALMARDIGN